MKNYKKISFKTKEDWLKAKQQTIGGSEAAAILNKSKWLTLDDVYNKFVYGKEKSVQENERMIKGTRAEDHIRQLFGLDTDEFEVISPAKKRYVMYVRKDKPYISCTPDGFAIVKANGRKYGLEIKDVELRKNAEINTWEGNTLPDQYYCQCLQYLVAMNDLDGVILVAHLKKYGFDNETKKWFYKESVTRPYFIYRKSAQAAIAYLEGKETTFYEENVKKRVRPKLVIKI